MSEALLNSVVEKMDAHERKIDEVRELLQALVGDSEVLNVVKNKVDTVKSLVEKIHFPAQEMRELWNYIVTSVTLLKQPVKQEIVHHDHASKIIWVAAALFLIVCLISVSCFIAYGKLNLYKENDTKYRYLKLEADKSLNKKLDIMDSMYIANPEMREIVIAREEQNKRDIEMIQRALRMEKEAKELKKKVNAKRNR